jgi:hypothetical protein
VFLYEARQSYEENDENIEVERMRYSGVWILTVFVYMNVHEYGQKERRNALPGPGTNGLSVRPRPRRVVLWLSFPDHDQHFKDERTKYQAMPVLKGVKQRGVVPSATIPNGYDSSS